MAVVLKHNNLCWGGKKEEGGMLGVEEYGWRFCLRWKNVWAALLALIECFGSVALIKVHFDNNVGSCWIREVL